MRLRIDSWNSIPGQEFFAFVSPSACFAQTLISHPSYCTVKLTAPDPNPGELAVNWIVPA
jgi:hypothetical protein